ncbi:uncharacterized protein LOC143051776 isoform X3 [Mytilus galloprovincialis]|uniref:uncharacterized protein LOC143051776 isoform X3 n=1 Tax=Mytilus galloprovincialis TaxID=29158 RepID=UPI003F7C0CA2
MMESIRTKAIGLKFMDIFLLREPPKRFKVREADENFVETLANVMIEKKSVSVDNAPNIVGLIDMNKLDYNDENFSEYEVYIVDGNHSIKAQKKAYGRTKDCLFRHRGVFIYCGLTENEALLLGISRNEDTEAFVKFSDFQKVDVLRRRLYSMTGTPAHGDPPKVPKEFKDVFSTLLNLKGKKAIDSKSILRFLATGISCRCYDLFKNICTKSTGKIPASKFDGIKGLKEEDVFFCLNKLASSDLHRKDWQKFSCLCQSKQTKPKKLRKDVTLSIKFQTKTTQGFVGQKQLPGNYIWFHFDDCDNKEVIFSDKQMKKLVFSSKDKLLSESSNSDLDDEHLSVDNSSSQRGSEDLNSTDNFSTAAECGSSTSFPGSTSLTSIGSKSSQETSFSMELSGFLHHMADLDAVIRAQSGLFVIEEEEVETKPENLLSHTDILLCPETQTSAKTYFSKDAWQLVLNTLKVLEDMYISNTQKYYDRISPCQTRKGKALIGPVEGRIFKKFSKRTSDQIKSSSRDKKSFDSDDRSPLKARKSLNSKDSSPYKARNGKRSVDNSSLKARKSFTNEDSFPLKARKSLTSEDSSPLKARKSLTSEDSSPLKARKSLTSEDSSPLKAIKGMPTSLVIKAKEMKAEIIEYLQNYKPFKSLPKVGDSLFNHYVDNTRGISEEVRDELTSYLSLTYKDIFNLSVSSDIPSMMHNTISFIIHHSGNKDLNNPIDVCPNLERTSETTGEYERIGKNTKKDAITGLINHSSTKDKKAEIGRKRSGNKKIYTAESKKCTVRLTDIGTIKNLKTYVNKTEKKRKRRKICVKNL